MRHSRTFASLGALALFSLVGPAAHAVEMGVGARAGTFGLGVDFDLGLIENTLNLRLGYNTLGFDYTVDDTDVRYDGEVEINSFSAMLDWHVVGGSFRVSLGAVGSGPEIDIVGTPSSTNTYTIGNTTYTAAQIGSVRGKVELGNSVAPYIGLGFGNVAGSNRVSFLFDVGLIYGGTPDVSLTATCGTALSTTACNTLQTQLQNDVRVERQELEDDVSAIKWFPVISFGIGVRF